MKKLKLGLCALALCALQQGAFAHTEVVCSSNSQLAHAGHVPEAANANSINARILQLQAAGFSVKASVPSIAISTSSVNANLGVSMVCVTLDVEKNIAPAVTADAK